MKASFRSTAFLFFATFAALNFNVSATLVRPQAAPAAHVSLLEGAPNFRDIGGYLTTSGRHVRRGLVYRSNQLSDLTAADYQKLAAMNIKLICDFRTDGERGRQPTRWQGAHAPEMMRAQILKDDDVVLSPDRIRELTTNASANSLGSAYERMLTPDAAEEYGRLYKRIAAGDLPLIAHCSAGKDRTGVFSAVLLTILEVPRSSVLDDYMLTGEYMLSSQALTKASIDFQKITGASEAPTPADMRAIYTMHPEVMTNTFAAIDRQYGSFDVFVRDGLKLTSAETAAIRSRLLD